MRKLCVVLLASLSLLPAAALAERGSGGDGSLVVSDAAARLTLWGRGLIFGHLARGTITVVGDYRPDDNTALSTVSGAKMRLVGGNVVYSGTNVRFLFPSGRYTLIVDGTGIDISAVGSGRIATVAKGTFDDGTIAADGDTPEPVDLVDSPLVYGKTVTGLSSSGKAKNG